MSKSLYGIVLTDDVVSRIDHEAMRKGVNRSALIEAILADHVGYTTPEKRIGGVFGFIEQALKGGELVPFVEANKLTMSMKSSLDYRYRPTIRYELQLYRVPDGAIGKLSIILRTQSLPLLRSIGEYFRLIQRLEAVYLGGLYDGRPPRWSTEDSRVERFIKLPKGRDYSTEELAESIAEYVRMLDRLMKDYLYGLDAIELENRYLGCLNRGVGII